MKKLNKKGFTLIELLAVIVVLAIILVITVPMILNTLGDTKSSALQSSANAAAKFYEDQFGLKLIGKGESDFAKDSTDSNGKLVAKTTERYITVEEANRLGLNTDDYAINSSCTNAKVADTACTSATGNYSKVKWDANGKTTVTLHGVSNGNFGAISKTSNN